MSNFNDELEYRNNNWTKEQKDEQLISNYKKLYSKFAGKKVKVFVHQGHHPYGVDEVIGIVDVITDKIIVIGKLQLNMKKIKEMVRI